MLLLDEMTQIETQRLIMLPFNANDAETAHGWFSDPEVMKYIPGGHVTNPETTKSRIAHYINHQDTHGFSKWMVRQKGTGIAIGDGGILWSDELNTFELGFCLAHKFWSMGYASEITKAWVGNTTSCGINNLMAFSHIENHIAHRVLEKSGFQYFENKTLYNSEEKIFKLE